MVSKEEFDETATPSVRFINPFTVCSADPIVVLPVNQVESFHCIVRYSSTPLSLYCGVCLTGDRRAVLSSHYYLAVPPMLLISCTQGGGEDGGQWSGCNGIKLNSGVANGFSDFRMMTGQRQLCL